jgi:nucleotide-binding universal stress UspA family protein
MFKDLLVPITGVPADDNAVDAALTLAKAFEAHLSAIEVMSMPLPMGSPWGAMFESSMSDVYDEQCASSEARMKELKVRMNREGVLGEAETVRALFAVADRVAAQYARRADLTVLAGAIGDTSEATAMHIYFNSLLFESGRPVLVVPPKYRLTTVPKKVLVAWRSSPEAARALHDAMPFLRGAEQVNVLVVNPGDSGVVNDDASGLGITTHLARHGIKATLVQRDSGAQSVSDILLDYARESYAQLIVAGGYGHSRLREWALGGATRELLIGASIPVFYSH